MPGTGELTLTGHQGEVMQSARVALSWVRANAARYGVDPAFHRDTGVHLHVQSGEAPKEGIVKLRLTAVSDPQHGGFTAGSSPVSWGSLDELFVNLTVPPGEAARAD